MAFLGQVALQNKEIDMGHARALLTLDNPKEQIKIFNEITKHGYSVRKVEELVKEKMSGEDTTPPKKKAVKKSASKRKVAVKKKGKK